MAQARHYYIETYGCQMNVHDSEALAGQLEQAGYVPVDAPEQADLVLLNTCAVRERAAEKTLGEIGRLKAIKAQRPEMLIGVCGCLAQVDEFVQALKRQAPHVDLVFGTHNLHELPSLLRRAEQEPEMVVDVWRSAGEVVEDLPRRRAPGARAWLNIIYGCDKYCTFCIVPHTRGRERSRRPGDVLAEARALAAQGYREITVLGQNVNSYGKDLGIGYDFADLLADLEGVAGLRWIRYMTSHPRDFTDKLIDFLARSRKVCQHVHLPVQSGSTRILRRMNRRYTREQYLERVRRIRAAMPEASLTTDIIVGFPGETEEDFQETLSLVAEVRYDNAFTFIYSPRPGTPAARWPDPVSQEEKRRRLERLNELQYRISLENNQRLVGRRFEVLVEGPSKKDARVLSARTATNKLVLMPGSAGLAGRFCEVEIVEARTWTLAGRFVRALDEAEVAAGA